MSRRRRKKNPLLGRIIAISVGLHVIALPILAHFGAFQKLQDAANKVSVVMLTSAPEEQKEKPKEKPAPPKKSAAKSVAHRGGANLNAPKVVTSDAAPDSASGDGPAAVESGTGKAGVVPTTKEPTPAMPQPQPQPEAVKPAPKADVEKPAPTEPTATPHVPVFAGAKPIAQPLPVIPDDYRAEDLSKDFVAEFEVGADGVPTDVKVAQSTGIFELDRLALEAAKKWRFQPATRDGQPVPGKVRLTIEFRVEGG
ncbi:MAG: TonB family protein [Armatimonadetes bacterium]|nr:TonB family protein [Armatimonadota bacterium]